MGYELMGGEVSDFDLGSIGLLGFEKVGEDLRYQNNLISIGITRTPVEPDFYATSIHLHKNPHKSPQRESIQQH